MAAERRKKKRPTYPDIQCADCGATAPRTGPVQKYCAECSTKRDLIRKKKHHLEKGRAAYEFRRTEFGERGVMLNSASKLTPEQTIPDMPKMAWYRRVAIPFSWAGSKNHIFSNTRDGHVFMRAEASYMRALLTEEVAKAVRDVRVCQNKLWLDIFVEKPAARGDAVNFVDMVCDAVKDGVLLDDKWFSIRSVDWQIVKKDPMLYVGLGQQDAVNVQACSSCGRLLTYDSFQKNRARPAGIGLNCRECQATKTRQLKRTRSEIAAAIEHGVGVFG